MNPEKLQYVCGLLSIILTVAMMVAYFAIYGSLIQLLVRVLLAGGSVFFMIPLVWWLVLDSRKVVEKAEKKGA